MHVMSLMSEHVTIVLSVVLLCRFGYKHFTYLHNQNDITCTVFGCYKSTTNLQLWLHDYRFYSVVKVVM